MVSVILSLFLPMKSFYRNPYFHYFPLGGTFTQLIKHWSIHWSKNSKKKPQFMFCSLLWNWSLSKVLYKMFCFKFNTFFFIIWKQRVCSLIWYIVCLYGRKSQKNGGAVACNCFKKTLAGKELNTFANMITHH